MPIASPLCAFISLPFSCTLSSAWSTSRPTANLSLFRLSVRPYIRPPACPSINQLLLFVKTSTSDIVRMHVSGAVATSVMKD